MTSHHLSSFFLLLLPFVLLLLSPQTQAREGKFFSFFTHFTTTSHKLKSHPPSPSPAPSSSESIAATPESILAAPAPAPESSTEVATPVPSPAESEFVDRGDGYGLYGTTSFENNNDNHESFKTGFGTKLYSNYNNNNNKNEELYKNNNEELSRNNYNNYNQEYYSNNHRSNNYYEDSYYSNNNNDRYSYNNNNFYSNNNGYNGYERKREGMSDTRFVENGKYFYDVKGGNQKVHYNVDGYEPTGRGSTTTENNNYGGRYYENNNNYRKYPNEFDTMEEYEKQQENQGYVP